jgi:hypothetical protein
MFCYLIYGLKDHVCEIHFTVSENSLNTAVSSGGWKLYSSKHCSENWGKVWPIFERNPVYGFCVFGNFRTALMQCCVREPSYWQRIAPRQKYGEFYFHVRFCDGSWVQPTVLYIRICCWVQPIVLYIRICCWVQPTVLYIRICWTGNDREFCP